MNVRRRDIAFSGIIIDDDDDDDDDDAWTSDGRSWNAWMMVKIASLCSNNSSAVKRAALPPLLPIATIV